jgi:hypothetical protein
VTHAESLSSRRWTRKARARSPAPPPHARRRWRKIRRRSTRRGAPGSASAWATRRWCCARARCRRARTTPSTASASTPASTTCAAWRSPGRCWCTARGARRAWCCSCRSRASATRSTTAAARATRRWRGRSGPTRATSWRPSSSSCRACSTGSRRCTCRSAGAPSCEPAVRAAIETLRAHERGGEVAPECLRDARGLLGEERMVKDADALACLRQAIEISGEAHLAGMRATRPGMYEYEIAAVIEGTFLRHGTVPGYTSIVGAGAHATVLHYIANRGPLPAGELLLVDAGAEWELFTGDITRVWPISGRFTPAAARPLRGGAGGQRGRHRGGDDRQQPRRDPRGGAAPPVRGDARARAAARVARRDPREGALQEVLPAPHQPLARRRRA